MSKFIRTPVVIEATQWFKSGDHPDDNRETFDAGSGPFLGEGKVVRYYCHPYVDGQSKCKYCDVIMHDHGWIDTGKAGHTVCPGDWIITGNTGKYYPCKPNTFNKAYEAV